MSDPLHTPRFRRLWVLKILLTLSPPPWDGRMADPRETRYSPPVTVPNSVIIGQTVRGIIWIEIRQKILTPRAPPFKVTQGSWNRHVRYRSAAYDFMLMSRSNTRNGLKAVLSRQRQRSRARGRGEARQRQRQRACGRGEADSRQGRCEATT